MKEKYIFSGILIIAIIGIGAIVYRSYYREGAMYAPVMMDPGYTRTAPTSSMQFNEPTSMPATSLVVASGIIRYIDNGFSPAPLTVKVGTMVVFKNEGTAETWPASAPHPTHTDYPGFDAMKPIKPGQSYSFTFTRIGTWKYHNHLNPKQYGSVIVTE